MCVFLCACNKCISWEICHDFYQINVVKCVLKLISETDQTYNVSATAV